MCNANPLPGAIVRRSSKPNPYSARSEIDAYRSLGRLAESKAVYERAITRKPEVPEIHFSRYIVAFLEGDSGEMKQQLAWGTGKHGGEDELLSTQSDTEAYMGRFGRAKRIDSGHFR